MSVARAEIEKAWFWCGAAGLGGLCPEAQNELVKRAGSRMLGGEKLQGGMGPSQERAVN